MSSSTFDKQAYWDRRNRHIAIPANEDQPAEVISMPLRGQGDKLTGTFYPKGMPVPHVTREGEQTEYPNAQGQSLRRVKGKLTVINRTQARQKQVSRIFTKPGVGFKGHQRNEGKNPAVQLPSYPPQQTNHERHVARRQARQAA